MHLTILDRYIFREAVLTWAAVTFVLFAIMISHTLLRVLVKAGGGEIALASVLPLLLATSINLLVTIVPLGVYLGILLGLGRMYQDSEMVVLSASGCGPAKLYRPVLALGILCLLITFPLTVWVSPWAESWEQRIKSKTSDDNLASAVRPGEFVELQQGDLVLFARNFSPDGVLTDVFLRQIDEQSSEALEVASTAHYQTDLKTGEQYLVFVDGQRTVFDAQNAQTQVIDFGNHGVRIPE
ncbi:MAG: LptF/LptG family permease, partial [Pseudomonadota bacterium]